MPAAATASQNDAAALVALQRALGEETGFQGAATVLCTELARRCGAARVVLGWREGARLRPAAVSNAGDATLAPEQRALLLAAMTESIDQSATVAWPSSAAGPQRVARAHQALCRAGRTAAVTVPLAWAGRSLGALTAEFAADETSAVTGVDGAGAVGPRGLRLLEDASRLAAPFLHLLHERRPSPLRRLGSLLGLLPGGDPATAHRAGASSSSPAGTGAPGRGRSRRGRLVLFGVAVAALAVLGIVPIDRTVSAQARIEGEVQRIVAAPIKGYLQAVHVRPGDTVIAGQLLAELGDRDLELERSRLASEQAQHEATVSTALARGDRGAMAVARAKVDEARARLGLVEHQLQQVQLRAPMDGEVIQGDLWQSLNAPVERGQSLFTIAPAQRFRVIVELDERDIRDVSAAQPGRLALSALPWDTIPVRIERLAAVATAIDGRNVFELQARLDTDGTPLPPMLRPGLRGVVHLDAGRAPPLRTWGGRAADWLRRAAWRWMP
jgi:multidrug resistance efflux pump